VHSGFLAVYDSVEVSLKTALAASGARIKTLITGHSLGAALAVLCAPDLATNAPSGVPPEVHTFAGPRVGAPDCPDAGICTFARRFNEMIPTCLRIVNHWDIVPNLPPATTLYEHVGSAISLDGGFTLDLGHAHSLAGSYEPALERLAQQPSVPFHMAEVA
jgi:predicted lipase